MARRHEFVLTLVPVLAFAIGGCRDSGDEQEGVLARALIGPEGGEIAAGTVSLQIPAGALTAEIEIELRLSEVNSLTAPGYGQTGRVISVYPQGLELRQPASLTFDDGRTAPAVLFEQDGLVVAAAGQTAYINELARAVASTIDEDSVPRVRVEMPALGATPATAGTVLRDTAHLQMLVNDTPDLAVVLTIYDTQEAYEKPLNGTGDGECGFRLVNVAGGSLAGDCSEGYFTATVRTTTSEVAFDIEPFLSGKMETPVTVGLVLGGPEVAYQAGFFAFDTGACFSETCSGVGTCVLQGDSATCECEDGFVPVGLDCVCAPQCDGRVCGGDGCGGTCAPGCDPGSSCTDEGTCVPDEPPPPGDTGSESSDGGMGSTDGGMGSSDGGMGSTSGGSTGGSSG